MFTPRATITDRYRREGRDHMDVAVRAASKSGAIFTARLACSHLIPVRDQEVTGAVNKDNERVMNVWEVTVKDAENVISSWT